MNKKSNVSMQPFNKLLVSLDLTRMDEFLIRYTSFLCQKLGAEKVYFLHVIQDTGMTEEMQSLYPDMEGTLPDLIREDIVKKVEENFDSELDVETETVVNSGSVSDTVIEWARNERIDLAILGKKTGYRGKGILSGKILRLAHCNVLFVPESARFGLEQLQVPLDLSEFSRKALDKALEIADKTGGQVECQYVYSLPRQYFPYMERVENVEDRLEKESQSACDRFIGKSIGKRSNVRCVVTHDKEGDVAESIYHRANLSGSDLIVVGSKGRTNASSVLLGSTAEKLAGFEKSIPILIVKSEDENSGFLEFLFGKRRGK
jgi:nucleotide-binding universal stress UspA family protein